MSAVASQWRSLSDKLLQTEPGGLRASCLLLTYRELTIILMNYMIEDITKAIDRFAEERDWGQYHNPKDLAISVSLEASELLELFQWRTASEAVEEYPEELKEELADIMIYCLRFASVMGYDVEDIILSKLARNAVKYPVSKAKGKKDKYTEYTQEAGSDEK